MSEGPTNITSTSRTCGLCKFHRQHLMMSGENPWYKHYCGHPSSIAIAKTEGRGLHALMSKDDGREIGDTDNTPDWCPVVAERMRAPHQPSGGEAGAVARELKIARAEMRRARCAAELEDAKEHAEQATEKLLAILCPGEVELPEQPPMKSFEEVFAAIRAAGGDAWDKIEEPDGFIRWMRGEDVAEHPTWRKALEAVRE